RTDGLDVEPHLSTGLDVTRHRDTSCLDLTVGHVRGGQCLDAEITEGDLRATSSVTRATRVVLLAELDLTGDEHYADAPSATGASLRGARRRSPPRSSRPRDFGALACSRASSLAVRSPL